MEPMEDYFAAVEDWFSRRFSYDINRKWIILTPGVVFAAALAIRAFSNENDGVLIQTPVYYPFSQVIKDNKRELFTNPLKLVGGRYEIDFEDFERKIADNKFKIKLFILCSPHNPVGRVWTKNELTRMGDICLKHGCLIISDEIHCDFVFGGHTHHMLPTLSDNLSENTILCTSPSKTFNLAGLQISNIIIPNPALRNKIRKEFDKTGYSQLNTAGIFACQEAYKHGEPWLRELLDYLKGNLDFIREFLSKELPLIKLIEPEGTYLVWLDFRETGIDFEALDDFIVKKAKLWLDSGEIFGHEGLGFQRINIACPRKTLEQAMELLKSAFK